MSKPTLDFFYFRIKNKLIIASYLIMSASVYQVSRNKFGHNKTRQQSGSSSLKQIHMSDRSDVATPEHSVAIWMQREVKDVDNTVRPTRSDPERRWPDDRGTRDRIRDAAAGGVSDNDQHR